MPSHVSTVWTASADVGPVRPRTPPSVAPFPESDAVLGQLIGLLREALTDRWSTTDGLAEICHYALDPRGKLIRPVLLLQSALAVGGHTRHVMPAAVSAECGHVASLIHDDIIDGDDVRRGRPSVPRAYGLDDAILAGDALIFDMFAGLAECEGAGATPTAVTTALAVVARAGLDLCRGQRLESEMCRDGSDDVELYLTMIGLKTGAFFRSACECGAVLAGGDRAAAAALAEYGMSLGRAFQIHDDLLPFRGVIGEKPRSSDLRNGRRTLPLLLAHELADERTRARLAALLSGRAGDDVLDEVTAIVEEGGAGDRAALIGDEHAARAKKVLTVLPDTTARRELAHYADLACHRDR